MMDSYEFNKIAGAVLGTLVFVMFLGIFSNTIYKPTKPETPGYALPEASTTAEAPAAAAPEATPVAVLLAQGDVDRGARVAKQACGACHAFEVGAASRVGPTLGGIFGREIASVDGFSYSSSLVERRKAEGAWNYENMNAFIVNPRGYASNTRMAYAGERNETRRGDILAYLRSISPDAPPPPAPAPATEPAPAAP